MATQPKKPAYEPEREYDVRLARPVRHGGMKLLPRDAHVMTGAAILAIVEAEGEDVIDGAAPRQ